MLSIFCSDESDLMQIVGPAERIIHGPRHYHMVLLRTVYQCKKNKMAPFSQLFILHILSGFDLVLIQLFFNHNIKILSYETHNYYFVDFFDAPCFRGAGNQLLSFAKR